MKESHVNHISEAVARLCVQACCHLPADVCQAFAERKEKLREKLKGATKTC